MRDKGDDGGAGGALGDRDVGRYQSEQTALWLDRTLVLLEGDAANAARRASSISMVGAQGIQVCVD